MKWIGRIAGAALPLFLAVSAAAQGTDQAPFSAIRLGNTAVSGFPGVKLGVEKLLPGVDPAEKTVIDKDAPSLRIFDMSTLGADPSGQAVNPPLSLQIKARDIGQVFGLAFDNGTTDGVTPPTLYAGATSAYGLHIVVPDGNGQTKTLRAGEATAAWMDGQFGALPGATSPGLVPGPGSIWKIDGATGQASLFANVSSTTGPNSGPGIGDVAFDPSTKMVYASDLDTGLIHRFNATGADLSQFDHGLSARLSQVRDDGSRADITSPAFKTDDPKTWGFTQTERRIDGLAVHDGRLYYAVAEGPEIWSVGLETDGSFKPDARREIEVKAAKPSPVTSIVFDGAGRMILAQRGAVKNPADFSRFVEAESGQVLRYQPQTPGDAASPTVWVPEPGEFAIGFSPSNRSTTGGVALQYSFGPGGVLDLQTCSASLIATGDALSAQGQNPIHGLQINSAELVIPENQPPTRSAFVDFDGKGDDPDALGYVGDVAVAQNCDGQPGGIGPPPVVGEGSPGVAPPVVDDIPPVVDRTTPPVVEDPTGALVVTKTADTPSCSPKGGCAFTIQVSNPGAADVPGPIVIDEAIDAPLATMTGEPNAPWTCSKAAPFTCTHPGPVPAGGALEGMRVVFAPNTPAEITQVQNCASVQGAGAAAVPVCATVALDPNAPVQNGPIIVSKKAASACTTKGPCAFSITVTNTSDAEVKGPIVIDEQMDAPQAVPVDAQPNAPWTCEKTAPFSCSHPGPLAPDQSATLELSFIPNTPPEITSLKNCAIVKQTAPLQLLAPGKKAEVPVHRPFGGNPLIRYASFRAPTFDRMQSFVELTGNAGGTLDGGVANRNCLLRKAPEAFSFRQKNGAAITLLNVKVADDGSGKVTGRAGIVGSKNGSFDGTFNGVQMQIVVTWSDGTRTRYSGSYDADGNLSGTTYNYSSGETQTFKALQPSTCAVNQACTDYGTKAMSQVNEFSRFECGPLPVIMSANINDHINWCMANNRAGTAPLDVEHDKRQAFIDQCKATKKANATPKFEPVTKLKIKPPPGDPETPVGPVAEPAPEQCAVVPIGPETKPDDGGDKVQPVPSKLVLAKNPVASQCSDAGGGCDFMVSITNPGPEDFNGPIEFTDVPTTGDGQTFLNLTMSGGVARGEPGISVSTSCVRTGEGFKCTTNPKFPAKIAAGKTALIPMSFTPGAGTGATSIKNCAQLTGSADKQCANIPLVNGSLVRALKQGGGNTCVPECTFSITFKNVGNQEATAPFAFDDVFTPATAATTFTVVDGDFKCAKVDAVARCVATNRPPLKPGESLNVRIKMSGVAKSPEYKNCAEIVDRPGEATLKDFPGRCITIKDTAPIQPDDVGPTPKPLPRPNIAVVSMTPLTPTCAVKGTSAVKGNCLFEATFVNKGDADFEGMLRYDVTTSKHTAFVMQGNCRTEITDLTGASAQIYNCEVRKNVRLSAKGGIVSVLVDVEPGDRWTKNNVLKACTFFSYRSESLIRDIGIIKDDDSACGEVALDPFKVNVKKSGGENCQAGGECRFKIELFNPGPIDHNAPVTISDKLTGISSAQIVSISPALPCPSQPTQIPFSCTSAGNVRLDLDGKPGDEFGPKTFDMVVKLPADAKAFSNCAAVGAGDGGETGNGVGNQSCVSVQPKPAEPLPGVASVTKSAVSASCDETVPCYFNITVTNTGGQPIAGPIVIDDLMTIGGKPSTQVKLAGGPAAPWTCVASAAPGMQCSHPGPLASNASLTMAIGMQPLPGSLGTATEVTNCATLTGAQAGKEKSCATVPVKKAPPPKCFGDMVLDASGACACPPPTKWNGRACVRVTAPTVPPPPFISDGGINKLGPQNGDPCPRGQIGTVPNCRLPCPPGTFFTNGVCRRPGTTTPATPPVIKCPKGTTGIYPNCRASCPTGTFLENGVCKRSAPPPPRQCETGTTGVYPNCCPRGTKFINGACRRLGIPPPPPKCPAGTIGTPPACCPPGTLYQNGVCKRPAPPPIIKCPTGTIGTYPNCCPRGTHFIAGACRRLGIPPPPPKCPPDRPVGRPPQCCPSGTVFREGFCRPEKCSAGWIGLPPNCRPPPVTPSPSPKKPPPPPPPKTCQFGLPPSCTCPPGKSPVQGGCRSDVR